jgi:hypothetical protein
LPFASLFYKAYIKCWTSIKNQQFLASNSIQKLKIAEVMCVQVNIYGQNTKVNKRGHVAGCTRAYNMFWKVTGAAHGTHKKQFPVASRASHKKQTPPRTCSALNIFAFAPQGVGP